jgi:predicted ATPase
MLRRATIKNFKRYGPAGETFELRPTTLLLGANSAGKSSLFELLLLMKQSFQAGAPLQLHTSGPLLALGTFVNVVHGQSPDAEIALTLEDDVLGTVCYAWVREAAHGRFGVLTRLEVTPPRAARVVLRPAPVPGAQTGERFTVDPSTFSVEFQEQVTDGDRGFVQQLAGAGEGSVWLQAGERYELGFQLAPLEYPDADDSGRDATQGATAAAEQERARRLAEWQRVQEQPWERRRLGFHLKQAVECFYRLNDFIERGVTYLGPMRHPGHRLAALRDGRPIEVGATGEYLIEAVARSRGLLEGLNQDLEAMQAGYRLETRTPDAMTASIAELVLRQGDGDKAVRVGLPDVGFGMRQMLPVLATNRLAQMEVQAAHGDRVVNPIVMVEQPELHLHPRLAVGLMYALVRALVEWRRAAAGSAAPSEPRWEGPLLLLETHSEHMVLRLQRLVRDGALDADADVSLLAVEPSEDGTTSTVTRIPLKKTGAFARLWPRGFFRERDDELGLVPSSR